MLSMSMPSSLRLMSSANFSLIGMCLPHLGFLSSQGQTLAFSISSDELERSSPPDHSHFLCLLQESSLSYGR